jgi:hypothetical protein
MYNGIGLTTPRGRYVFYPDFFMNIVFMFYSAVPMAMWSATCPLFVHTNQPEIELTPGMQNHPNIVNQTKVFWNTRESVKSK